MANVAEPVEKARRSKQDRKQDRLKKRASKYVTQALEALENVENLVNLDPTVEQRTRILARLQSQFEQLTDAFAVTEKVKVKADTFEL